MLKVKSVFLVSLLSMTMFSCTQNSGSTDPVDSVDPPEEKLSIAKFYKDVKTRNFISSDDELTFTYYGNDAVKIQLKNQVDTAIVRLKQGIFEVHKTNTGYESHGMVTPNVEMDPLDSLNNFYRIVYIRQSNWKYVEADDIYTLKPTLLLRDQLVETGYVYAGVYEYIEDIVLKKDKDSGGYLLDVNYKETSKYADESYTVKVYNFGKCVDTELNNYIENTTLEPQTDWNDYQLSAMSQFGFEGVPFLKAYTLGLKLYFSEIFEGSYLFFVYDYLSNKAKETEIAAELDTLGFDDVTNPTSDVKRFTRPEISGYKPVIEFKFIPVDEIEGDANKEAFPNGYLQLVYSYVLGEEDTTLEAMNAKLNNMLLPSLPISSCISKVTTIDYKDATNASMYSDEALEVFEEMGKEPGPVYDEYRSIYLYIENKADAISYLDNYRQLIRGNDFVPSQYFDDSKSISEVVPGYYKFNANTDTYPMYEIYLYLYDYSSGDEFTGVCEIVIAKLTELGVEFYGFLQ